MGISSVEGGGMGISSVEGGGMGTSSVEGGGMETSSVEGGGTEISFVEGSRLDKLLLSSPSRGTTCMSFSPGFSILGVASTLSKSSKLCMSSRLPMGIKLDKLSSVVVGERGRGGGTMVVCSLVILSSGRIG